MSASRSTCSCPECPEKSSPQAREKVYFSYTDKVALEGNHQPPEQEWFLDAKGENFLPKAELGRQFPRKERTANARLSSAERKVVEASTEEGQHLIPGNNRYNRLHNSTHGRLLGKKHLSESCDQVRFTSKEDFPESGQSRFQSSDQILHCNCKGSFVERSPCKVHEAEDLTLHHALSHVQFPRTDTECKAYLPEHSQALLLSSKDQMFFQSNTFSPQRSKYLKQTKELVCSCNGPFKEICKVHCQSSGEVRNESMEYFPQRSKTYLMSSGKMRSKIPESLISRKQDHQYGCNKRCLDLYRSCLLSSEEERFEEYFPHRSRTYLLSSEDARFKINNNTTECLLSPLLSPEQLLYRCNSPELSRSSLRSSNTAFLQTSNRFPERSRSYFLALDEIDQCVESRSRFPQRSQSQAHSSTPRRCVERCRLERTVSDSHLPSAKCTYFVNVHNQMQLYDPALFEPKQVLAHATETDTAFKRQECKCQQSWGKQVPAHATETDTAFKRQESKCQQSWGKQHTPILKEGSQTPEHFRGSADNVKRKYSGTKIPDEQTEADTPHTLPTDLPNIFVMLQNISSKPARRFDKVNDTKAKAILSCECGSSVDIDPWNVRTSMSANSVESHDNLKGILKNKASHDHVHTNTIHTVLSELPRETMTDLARVSDPTTILLKYRMNRHVQVNLGHDSSTGHVRTFLNVENLDVIDEDNIHLPDIFGMSCRETEDDGTMPVVLGSETDIAIHVCPEHGRVTQRSTNVYLSLDEDNDCGCRARKFSQCRDPFKKILPLIASGMTETISKQAGKGKRTIAKPAGMSYENTWCCFHSISKTIKSQKHKVTNVNCMLPKRDWCKRMKARKHKARTRELPLLCCLPSTGPASNAVIISCSRSRHMNTNTSAVGVGSGTDGTKSEDKKDEDKAKDNAADQKAEEGTSGIPYSKMNKSAAPPALYGQPVEGGEPPKPQGCFMGLLGKICPCLAPKKPPPPPVPTVAEDQPPIEKKEDEKEKEKTPEAGQKADVKEEEEDDTSEEAEGEDDADDADEEEGDD